MAAPKVHSLDSVTTNTVAANRLVALSYYVSHIYRVFQLAMMMPDLSARG